MFLRFICHDFNDNTKLQKTLFEIPFSSFIFQIKLFVENFLFKLKARSVFVGLLVGEDGFEPPKV